MRRTVRALIAATMPSATAWRARSSLDQWVMCSPLATGSRQASWTIRARCRGGNPFGPARTVWCRHQPVHAPPFVQAAGPPDRGAIAFHPIGDCIDPLAAGDRQHGAGTADLKPWQRLATGDLSQGGGILRPERQIARSSTTHPGTSVSHRRYLDRPPVRRDQFVALLLTGNTSGGCRCRLVACSRPQRLGRLHCHRPVHARPAQWIHQQRPGGSSRDGPYRQWPDGRHCPARGE